MTIAKITIAVILLIAGFVYCEWFATRIPAERWGETLFVLSYPIVVNFSFLAVTAVVIGMLGPSVFPDSYFAAHEFEREGRIYRCTGILVLLAIFRLIGYERYWRRKIPVRKDLAALQLYADSTRSADATHMLAGISTVFLTVAMGLKYPLHVTNRLWITLFVANVLINLYPIMLQRYNRPRVERLIRLLERKSRG